MEFGCGGVGLRTSRGQVVNLYFWHLETEDGGCVRREDFLGRADSPRTKQELLRRMAMYNRRIEQKLAMNVARLEDSLTRVQRVRQAPLVIVEERPERRSRQPMPVMLAEARGI